MTFVLCRLCNDSIVSGLSIHLLVYFIVTNNTLFTHLSIAACDLYERTARCKIIGQDNFLSRLEMTWNETNGVRKF